MSAALAYAPQRRAPLSPVPPRHVEIVTTRAQRKARPKSFYAVASVAAVFTLFLAQLLLSILLSDGAYQISSLQAEQKQLSRTEQDLAEKLDLLASPQSLASRAGQLGMVVGGGTPAFLRLADGTIIGTPVAASATAGANGLVANALLQPEEADPAAEPQPAEPQTQKSTASGAAAADDGELPSPVTR